MSGKSTDTQTKVCIDSQLSLVLEESRGRTNSARVEEFSFPIPKGSMLEKCIRKYIPDAGGSLTFEQCMSVCSRIENHGCLQRQ